MIHLGTNDAVDGDVDNSVTAMTSIVEQLRSNNDSVSICLAQILPFGSDIPVENGIGPAELNAFVDSLPERLGALTSEMTTTGYPIVLVDMNTDFADANFDDAVHPNQVTAEKMATRWFECIAGF